MNEQKPEKAPPKDDREQVPGDVSAPGRVAGEPSTEPSRRAGEEGDHEMGHGGMLGAPSADAPPPGSPEADASARQAGGGHVGPPPLKGPSQHE